MKIKEKIYQGILVVFMMVGFVAGVASANKSENLVKQQVRELLADMYRAKEINKMNREGYKPEMFHVGISKADNRIQISRR